MFDYRKIIQKSIEVVRKNKWLWVLGALVGGGFGSGGGSGGGSSGGSAEIKGIIEKLKNPNLNIPDLPQKTAQVLGDYTNVLTEWFYSVSPLNWVMLSGGIILAVTFGIIVSMILHNWAKASLITGVQLALEGQKTDLINSSSKGREKLKSLIIFSLISTGITLGIIIPLVIIFGGIYLLIKKVTEYALLAMLFNGILFFFPIIIVFIFLAMISVYAERLIVLFNYTPWQAWKKGLSLSKGNFLGTAIMGLINTVATTVFGCLTSIALVILLGIPAFIIVYPNIKNSSMPGLFVILTLGIFLLVFIAVETLIAAVSAVFKFSNWNQIFNEIMNKELHAK